MKHHLSEKYNCKSFVKRLLIKNILTIIFCCIGILIASQKARGQDLSNLANSKPFAISGGINLTGIGYTASGIPYRRQPFTYLFTGNPTVNLYNFSIPLSFAISQSDRSYGQPFNEFGMSPTYKWLTVHVGYRNISFSPYTLGGHTILGAGFELNPGKLRLGFMYGRLSKATKIDTATQTLVPYSFSRKAYAARLGYGTDKNFFDVSFLSAKDDSTTAPKDLPAKLNTVAPAKNTVIGYSTRFTFLKNFFFESDGAISLYTADINSKLTLDSIKNSFVQKVKGVFGLNATSEYYTAFSGGLGYKGRDFGLKVNYKRIEPDFQTMGAYFFNSDLENWTVAPNASFFKGKIRFTGSIGFQHDNLRQQKRAQNQRLIANASTSVEVNKSFGFDVIYTNFSDNQQPRTAQFADSLRIVQTTQTFGIMPHYIIIRPDIIHVITASYNHSGLNDYNTYYAAGAQARGIVTNQYFINYNITFPKRQLNMFCNINTTQLSGSGMHNTYTGATVGGSISLLNQKLQTGLTGTVTNSSSNQYPGNVIINASGNVHYQVFKKQVAGLNIFITNNKTNAVNALQPNFTESRAELSYQVNF